MTDRLSAAIVGLIFLVGAACHGVSALHPFLAASTPWLLLSAGLYTLLLCVREQGLPLLLWAAAAATATFLIEVAGVATGAVFGSYRYGSVLGTTVWSVPPIIGFNWVLVVLGLSRAVALRRPHLSPVAAALIVGGLAAAFDWLLEPLAVRLGYWTWAGGRIPLQNYAAWFAIAFILALPLPIISKRVKSAFPSLYVAIQAAFFVVARFALFLQPA